MKKKTKKLVLSKETVRDLETPELRNAAGGLSTDAYSCFCPSYYFKCKITPD